MKRIILSHFVFFTLILILSSCKSKNLNMRHVDFTKTENGITINTPKGQVAFTVFDDDIIHVLANPHKIDYSTHSKIVEITPDKVKWEVVKQNNLIGVATSKMKALVNPATGAVSYYDNNNKLLLAEPAANGREFGENTIYGNKTQFVKQTFVPDKEEAFYGMGQNHNDQLNLRGSDLNLFQRNTEIYIPFLVSSKKYGILWDNYAHARFGSSKDAELIPDAVFEDSSGKKGKLTAEFFRDIDFKDPVEQSGWDGSMLFNQNLQKADSINAVRLIGTINIDQEGEYQFIKEKTGKLSLFIDGKRVMEFWQSILSTPRLIHLQLTKGKHKVVIEYTQIKGEFPILKWRRPADEIKDISIWSASAKNMDYYFIYGEKNMDDVISGFRQLTGKASLLPKWAYGFWQSRNRYKTQEEIVNTVEKLRSNKIPVDNIVQDWHYWPQDQWGSHDFDQKTFPNPTKMVKDIHDMHTNIMISVWGKFYPSTKNYKELDDAGALYTKYADEKKLDFAGQLNNYYDPYNAKGRKIYWDQINRSLYKYGIDAWWLDATEPSFDKNFDADTRAYYMEPNAFGKGYDYLNLYPLYTSKAVYEGQRSVDPDKRVFILTRSAFAGMQKYAGVAWSGDIAASWDLFKQEITAGLNYSLSGMPYWTDDVGGYISEKRDGTFFYDEFEELFTRWFQFGTFCPIFRVHGDEHPQEMWAFGKKFEDAQLKFDKLRYRLMPYIYSVAGAVTQQDYTMMRGLVFDFANDPKVLDITDQYMFGPSLLICPVTEYKAREREVYLPVQNGGWYDFWTGKHYEGGKKFTISAPLEEIPIFVKAGSIIPFGPELQYTSEKKPDSILLRVYQGADAAFSLYEDEGINYNYEKGKYTEIKASWNESKNQLTIADRKGMFDGMLKDRKFKVEMVSKDNPIGYDKKAEPSRIIEYTGNDIKIKLK